MAALGPAPEPRDLVAAPRVGLPAEWRAWFEAAGVEAPLDGPSGERIILDNQVLEVAAAEASNAFALASPVMFAADIASGRLVEPFPITTAPPQSYWLVYPKDRRRSPKIAAFREWLLAQVAEDQPGAAQPGLSRAGGVT